MLTVQDLQDKAERLQVEAKAILSLAQSENREPNTEEQARFDEIVGKADGEGLIAGVRAEIEKRERLDREMSIIGAKKSQEKQIEVGAKAAIRVPARARAQGKLQAFKTEEDAYAMGQWVRACFAKDPKAKSWCKEYGIKATMTTGDNTAGGFLVPEPLSASIIEQREAYGIARQECNVLQMGDAVMNIPRLNSEVLTYYVGEGSTITQSDPALNQVKLEAKKLAALTTVSSEMSEDSLISVMDLLARSVAQSLAIAEDSALFLGDGSSTFGGIVGLQSAIQAGSRYTATSRQTFGALTFADFEAVVGLVKMWRGAQPKWYISQAGWANSFQRLMDSAGGVTMAEISGGASRFSFMGYPVVISQVLESRLTGTTGATAMYFGDLRSGVYMGSRRNLTMSTDTSRYFEQDVIAIRATQRYDINVFDRGTASASGGIVRVIFG